MNRDQDKPSGGSKISLGQSSAKMDINSEGSGILFANASALDLASNQSFRAHPWVAAILQQYHDHGSILAKHARLRTINDLMQINQDYFEREHRVAFSDIQGRVKAEDSLLRKLHKLCRASAQTRGITQSSIQEIFSDIKDLCGVRVSCPYFDEIIPAINTLIRPRLSELGYVTTIVESEYKDKDYLDNGDEFGYRSYHFYIRVPAIIDIFGSAELVLCEVQVRSELQHIWAEKSHDLLYKPDEGWHQSDDHVFKDMRQISNLLRSVDQLLVSVRDRVHGG
jgi:ppGpp synthetase/RelA/SpoT-type nucleotidyltranferase